MTFSYYASSICSNRYISVVSDGIEPGPGLAHKLYAVEVDYGDGVIINTQTYACSSEEAANQIAVKRVLYEIKEDT